MLEAITKEYSLTIENSYKGKKSFEMERSGKNRGKVSILLLLRHFELEKLSLFQIFISQRHFFK